MLAAVLVGLAGCGGTASGVPESTAVEQSATPAGPAPPPSGFVYIAPGTFMMGSPSSEEGRSDFEAQHQVTLTRGFYLQTTEVTQGEWQAVMGNNPSFFTSCGSDCPVEQVSWLDAVGYANALARAEGLSECYDRRGEVRGSESIYDCAGYRLPTEAEWEYAARAGTTGSRYGALDQVAWYRGNSGWTTHAVGGLQSNAWGLYDMLGNVWEWTHDGHGVYGGTTTDPAGALSGSSRVVRGSSWFFDASFVRSAYRSSFTPGSRSLTIGFRLARSH